LQTKGALQTLLQESRISGPDLDFQWKYRGIAVVAEFSNLSNLLLFEEACKKGLYLHLSLDMYIQYLLVVLDLLVNFFCCRLDKLHK
jgi:hypothetical protein